MVSFFFLPMELSSLQSLSIRLAQRRSESICSTIVLCCQVWSRLLRQLLLHFCLARFFHYSESNLSSAKESNDGPEKPTTGSFPKSGFCSLSGHRISEFHGIELFSTGASATSRQ